MGNFMRSIEVDYIRTCLEYDKSSGRLAWLTRPISHFATQASCDAWNKKYAGTTAGNEWTTSSGCNKYRSVSICGTNFREHRVIWALVYGYWPKEQIDHIDGNGTNNSLENLREATAQINCMNLAKFKNNTTGICGVWRKGNRWRASISKAGKRHDLGYHDNLLDAACARKSQELKMGFSVRHGT